MSGQFRSTLLNHWARKNQKRPPVAVVPWLRTTSSGGSASSAYLHPDDESLDSLFSATEKAAAAAARSPSPSPSPSPSDCDAGRSRSGTGYSAPPSLSSVDTAFTVSHNASKENSSSGSSASSDSSALSSSYHSPPPSPVAHKASSPWAKRVASRAMAIPSRVPLSMPMISGSANGGLMAASARMLSTLPSLAETERFDSDSLSGADNKSAKDDSAEEGEEPKPNEKGAVHAAARTFQSLLVSCATPPKILVNTRFMGDEVRLMRRSLRSALDRAMLCACAVPLSTPMPFTMKRMFAPSTATDRLADIVFQCAGRSEKKRSKWLRIPAFVVAIAHGNQSSNRHCARESNVGGGSNTNSDSASITDTDSMFHEPQPFVPPKNERQMEDFAATRAAAQRLMMSLASERIGSKLVSKRDEPITRTSAFRDLVLARPTDRVAALILVGDVPEEDINQVCTSQHHQRPSVVDL